HRSAITDCPPRGQWPDQCGDRRSALPQPAHRRLALAQDLREVGDHLPTAVALDARRRGDRRGAGLTCAGRAQPAVSGIATTRAAGCVALGPRTGHGLPRVRPRTARREVHRKGSLTCETTSMGAKAWTPTRTTLNTPP